MISEIETTTDPVLSREDAIAILNTPDEELDQLIAQAEKLRRKYKGRCAVYPVRHKHPGQRQRGYRHQVHHLL